MRVVQLSHPVRVDDPLPPSIPPPVLVRHSSVADGDDANVYIITIANHSGTHVDAPRHVIDNGISITEFEPYEFLFERPIVIDVPLSDSTIVAADDLARHFDAIQHADLLLIRFGYGPIRATDSRRYSTQCPGFGIDSACYLRANFPDLRAIGIDVPSFSCIAYLKQTMRAHNIVFAGDGRRFMIVEDMNLNQDLTGLKQVWIAPLLVDGIDSAPCVVFGVIE